MPCSSGVDTGQPGVGHGKDGVVVELVAAEVVGLVVSAASSEPAHAPATNTRQGGHNLRPGAAPPPDCSHKRTDHTCTLPVAGLFEQRRCALFEQDTHLRLLERVPASVRTGPTVEGDGGDVNYRNETPGKPRNPWKRKMGVEFSGLEAPRDFLVAILALVGLVLVAMVIAFVAFG
jgi:hypothetical protein